MGIQGLTTLLRSKCPNYITRMDITKIQRVAIDGNQWMTSMLKIHFRNHLEKQASPMYDWTAADDAIILQSFKRDALLFSLKWMSIGLVPVWIVDGKSPIAKEHQKAKRQKARDSAKERFDTLVNSKRPTDAAATNEPLNEWVVDSDTKSEYKDGFTEDEVRKLISYRQQHKALTSYFVKELKDFLLSIGIPLIQSVDEGERLACMLYHAGLVDAVFSTDTDCLVYRCKHIIHQFFVEASQYMPIYNYDVILETLKMSPSEFTDFCILLGTDYNNNIHKIGPVKALELIQTYSTIDKLPKEYKKIPIDTSKLNYDVCISIFTVCDPADLCASPMVTTIDLQKLANTSSMPFPPATKRFLEREITFAIQRYKEIMDTKQASL